MRKPRNAHDDRGATVPASTGWWAARLYAAALVVIVAAVTAAPFAGGVRLASAAPSLPAGFTRVPLPSGVGGGQLTDFVFLPGGGTLSTGKSGAVVRADADGTAHPVATVAVDDRVDQGLIGIELANDYARSGHLYTVYQHVTATSTFSRLSRWTAVNPAAPTALVDETVVLDGISQEHPDHEATTVVVGPDDTLWLSVGDASSYNYADQLALRAQDRNDPHGKLLHVYPDGKGVPSNPYYDAAAPDSWASRVYASGFRSPFRLSLRPGSGVPYVGDVGYYTTEEVDVVRAGGNYGWPCWEGVGHPSGYADFDVCKQQYASPPVGLTAPLWSYPHALPPGGGASVTGGVFYTGTTYPAQYRGAYVFGDYARSQLWTLTTDDRDALTRAPEAGDPALTSAAFGSGMGGPVRVRTGPGDDVYYADIYTGTIWRLRYAPGNRAPVAVGRTTQDSSNPFSYAFSAATSYDPDGDAMTYRWDFGDGTTAGTAEATHTYASIGTLTARLTVTDALGLQAGTDVAVAPGHRPPSLVVTETSGGGTGKTFAVGDPVRLTASAVDEAGKSLDQSVTWATNLYHCPQGVCHLHPGPIGTGATFSVDFTDHGSDTRMEITAKVTDSYATTTQTYTAQPDVRTLTVLSSPPGVVVNVGASNTAAGASVPLTVGGATSLAAPLQSGDLVFDKWSDGVTARTRTLTMPRADLTLTALYRRAGVTVTSTSSPTTGLAVGTPVRFDLVVRLAAGTDLPLYGLQVTSSACTTAGPGGDNGDGVLSPQETWLYTCTRVLGASDLPLLKTTAQVTGTSAAGAVVRAATSGYLPPSASATEQQYRELSEGGQTDLTFVRGTDGQLWGNAVTATTGYSWVPLGGYLTSDPEVASTGRGRLQVFARGGDNQLWSTSWNGATWSSWQPLGGVLASGPGAVSAGSGTDVFVVGTDNQLWHRSFDGGTWSAWEPLGGYLTSDPDVASAAPGTIDVFARGGDGRLWARHESGTTWGDWQLVGGVLASGPTAVSSAPGRIDVFVQGTDSHVWHTWTAGTWAGWDDVGGLITGDPDVASWARDRLDVFAPCADGQEWFRSSNGVSWTPWRPLGAGLSSGPSAVAWPAA